jgi:hypothetical protein
VNNNIVTEATATGRFSSYAPTLGAPLVNFGFSNDLTFNYDLGEFEGHDLDVLLDFTGSGEAYIVPEPSCAGLLLFGLVSCLWLRRGVADNR